MPIAIYLLCRLVSSTADVGVVTFKEGYVGSVAPYYGWMVVFDLTGSIVIRTYLL